MVSIAPNQYKVEGVILSKEKDASLDNFSTVTVRADHIEPVEGPAHFLDPSTSEVSISVADAVAANWKEGMHLECKIRKAPGHFFVLPDSVHIRE